jgi:hypothetical protein
MARQKQEGWQGKRGEFTEGQDGKQGWQGLDQVSAGQPNTCHSIGIIEPLLTLDRAGPLFRMDPMSCSARFFAL